MSDVHATPAKAHAHDPMQAQMPEGEQLTNSFAPPSFSLTAEPVQRKEGTVQMAPGDLRTQMDRLFTTCPVVDQRFMDTIHNATTAERQAILNDQRYRDAIRTSIGGEYAMMVMMALMEGSQEWSNPPSNDFYDFFVTRNGDGPMPNTATMNCWESILYAAYLAGQTTADYIRRFYSNAMNASDPNARIWQQLGFSTSLSTYPTTTPRSGQWIFYVPAGRSIPSHIALSQGGDNATSLWNQPNNVDSVQRIQVNDLATSGGTIYIGNPVLR